LGFNNFLWIFRWIVIVGTLRSGASYSFLITFRDEVLPEAGHSCNGGPAVRCSPRRVRGGGLGHDPLTDPANLLANGGTQGGSSMTALDKTFGELLDVGRFPDHRETIAVFDNGTSPRDEDFGPTSQPGN